MKGENENENENENGCGVELRAAGQKRRKLGTSSA